MSQIESAFIWLMIGVVFTISLSIDDSLIDLKTEVTALKAEVEKLNQIVKNKGGEQYSHPLNN